MISPIVYGCYEQSTTTAKPTTTKAMMTTFILAKMKYAKIKVWASTFWVAKHKRKYFENFQRRWCKRKFVNRIEDLCVQNHEIYFCKQHEHHNSYCLAKCRGQTGQRTTWLIASNCRIDHWSVHCANKSDSFGVFILNFAIGIEFWKHPYDRNIAIATSIAAITSEKKNISD